MSIDISDSQRGDWAVLHLQGRLDEAGAKALKEKLLPLATGGSIALDFNGVDYVTSSGFRVLMIAAKEQKARGGRLVLGHLRPTLRQFFDLAGLGVVFPIVDSLNDIFDSQST